MTALSRLTDSSRGLLLSLHQHRGHPPGGSASLHRPPPTTTTDGRARSDRFLFFCFAAAVFEASSALALNANDGAKRRARATAPVEEQEVAEEVLSRSPITSRCSEPEAAAPAVTPQGSAGLTAPSDQDSVLLARLSLAVVSGEGRTDSG